MWHWVTTGTTGWLSWGYWYWAPNGGSGSGGW
jgi:hypothetical protein